MSDSTFQREDRYIVIKRSDLESATVYKQVDFHLALESLSGELPNRDCLVIESDWPEYEPAWQMIVRRMGGKPAVTAAEELEAVLHWRRKHDQAIKARDALQQSLTTADQRIDELESWCRRIMDSSETMLSTAHEEELFALVEPADAGGYGESAMLVAALSASAEPTDEDWRMNPCKQGHRDVGAAGGVAHCYTCDEKITAATTQEAFEQWNATHPAAEPAMESKPPVYKPGLYAVRHIDNWDGERDVVLTFALLDADGKWTDKETGEPLLTYKGDKVLRAWPLDCSAAPGSQIIGVPRDWLEDWALELVEAAQDGGQMSNQVEHLLEIHPKP